MAGSFDPCREWLGIDPTDLVSPHLVLGVAATETDPLMIVRAADQRLARLRDVDAGPLAHVRDGLAARVEQSRDTMLAGVSAVHNLGRGISAATPVPPVPAPQAASGSFAPPPVPPAVPGSAAAGNTPPTVASAPSRFSAAPAPAGLAPPPRPFQPAVSAAEQAPAPDFAVRVQRKPTYQRSSGAGGALALLALLVAVAGGLTAYAIKQPAVMKALFGTGKSVAVASQRPEDVDRRDEQRRDEKGRGEKPRDSESKTPSATPADDAAPKDGLDALQSTNRPPRPSMERREDSAPPGEAAAMKPADTPRADAPEPPTRPAGPMPPEAGKPEPSQPEVTAPDEPAPPPQVDQAQLDASLRAAYASLRHQDFDAAAKEIDKAAKIAADDAAAKERVQLWERFATYARDFKGHLDKALDAKKDGGDFPYKDRVIGVVEVGPTVFKYRDEGETIRVPRNEIPDDIAIAIVTQWFAADGRAANDIFIGVRQLAKRKPNAAAARDAWQRAADGGESEGRALQALLGDPAIAGP